MSHPSQILGEVAQLIKSGALDEALRQSPVSGGRAATESRARFNVHDLALAEPMRQVYLPSPYETLFTGQSNNEHAYGTPIYFSNPWHGYSWWMVGAPYPTRVGGICTISNASPGVISYAGHPYTPGQAVQFSTTGSLPTGLTAGAIYYVLNDGNYSANQFCVATAPGGSAVNTSSAGSGVHRLSIYASKYENPTIYVSNDGENWIKAPGARSPLFDCLGITSGDDLNSYYADPYITYDTETDKLYLLWCWFSRAGTIKSSLMISESTDGISWTAPVEIHQSTSATFTPNSPSLIRTATGWTMVGIDTRDGTGTFSLIVSRTTNPSPYTGWAAPAAVYSGVWSQGVATHPLGRNWWHQYTVQGTDGNLMMLAADGGSGGGSAYSLGSSDGGLTWGVRNFSAWDTSASQGTWYRPGLCICADGAQSSIRLFASRINSATETALTGFWMKTARLKDGLAQDAVQRMLLRDAVHRQLTAPVAMRAVGLVFWDSFNRADGAIGTSDSGVSWTAVDANTITISGNRATNSSTNNCRVITDTGVQDYDFEVQIQTVGSSWNVLFGWVDSANYWRFGNSVVPTGLQRISGGAVSATAPSTWTSKVTLASGDIVRISKRGPRYSIFHNDRIIDSFLDLWTPSSSKVGLQASGASASFFDNVIISVA